jgi:hypothetical protein
LKFPRIIQQPRPGNEPLHFDGNDLGVSVIDFWRWSASDLLSNATRGRFAEFIVAKALDIPFDLIRDEWGAYDLLTPDEIKVEVKSAAYIQSWYQEKLSNISFKVPKTRSWSPETNKQAQETRRQADVYVFALLAHTDQVTIDPLNLNQWQFFVLPTEILNSRTRSQHSITYRSLVNLSGGSVMFNELKNAVQKATSLVVDKIETL